jgi:hypothetical protein
MEDDMAEVARSTAEPVGVDVRGASAPVVGGAELPSLRSEGERLQLERDNAQLRIELAQLGKPWWRKASIVTMLTAIIAAVVPVTTAIQAHSQQERELALQESKQGHEIRTSYLDRLDKPGAKLRTLRFVLATTTDPTLKDWAREEMKQVRGELEALERQLDAAKTPEELRDLEVRERTRGTHISKECLDNPLGKGCS